MQKQSQTKFLIISVILFYFTFSIMYSLKVPWGGDEWISYRDFTIMGLPFSLFNEVFRTIIGPVNSENYIFYRFQGIIWYLCMTLFLLRIFCKNIELKKFCLYGIVFISVSPFVITLGQFYRYYQLYLFISLVIFVLLLKWDPIFDEKRKYIYLILLILPLIHFFIFWQFLLYIIIKEVSYLPKHKIKYLLVFLSITFMTFSLYGIEILSYIWNLYFYNYPVPDSITLRGYSLGRLLKIPHSIFVFLFGPDLVPLEHILIDLCFIIFGITLLISTIQLYRFNKKTFSLLINSGVIPFLSILLILEPISLPGMTSFEPKHSLFLFPWIIFLFYNFIKYQHGKIVSLVLFVSLINANYLTVQKQRINWKQVVNAIGSTDVPIITDVPSEFKFNSKNENIYWFKNSDMIDLVIKKYDVINLSIMNWKYFQPLSVEQMWNSARSSSTEYHLINNILDTIMNDGYTLSSSYSSFPLQSYTFTKDDLATKRRKPVFYDIPYQDISFPIYVDKNKLLGFDEINDNEEIPPSALLFYTVRLLNDNGNRPCLEIEKKDGEIDTLALIVDHDRYRKNYNRGFVGSEVIHTYKKSPLVSNSLKYPGSIFPTEGYIYRLQIDEEINSIKFINSDAILYSFIAYD